MTCSGIGGADGVGVGGSLDGQQIFQMQNPMARVQIVAAIMAAGDVKAQCGSGTCMWSNLSSRMVASNSGKVLLNMTFSNLFPSPSFLCKKVSPKWRHECRSELEIV